MGHNPYPPGHNFHHLVPSDTPENIYYADLFSIGGHTWMIQGSGKTKAARIASGGLSASMYATDAVAIIRDGVNIFGRYDAGAMNPNLPELHALHKIDALAYCLDEKQTFDLFDSRRLPLEIVDSDAYSLSLLCATYSYPAYMAPHFFQPDELSYFADERRMTARFRELTAGVSGVRFLLVPFMPSVEEKASLYKSFCF